MSEGAVADSSWQWANWPGMHTFNGIPDLGAWQTPSEPCPCTGSCLPGVKMSGGSSSLHTWWPSQQKKTKSQTLTLPHMRHVRLGLRDATALATDSVPFWPHLPSSCSFGHCTARPRASPVSTAVANPGSGHCHHSCVSLQWPSWLPCFYFCPQTVCNQHSSYSNPLTSQARSFNNPVPLCLKLFDGFLSDSE